MKTAFYKVFINNDKWMEKVVDDFRWICTSGLFKKCDKLYITIPEGKANNLFSGEEWVRYFWGRVDDKKVEIQIVSDDAPDVFKWIKDYLSFHPDETVVYFGTNSA